MADRLGGGTQGTGPGGGTLEMGDRGRGQLVQVGRFRDGVDGLQVVLRDDRRDSPPESSRASRIATTARWAALRSRRASVP